MTRRVDQWASDTPVSLPDTARLPILLDFDGVWCFTAAGLQHNMTRADREELAHPTFAPDGWNG